MVLVVRQALPAVWPQRRPPLNGCTLRTQKPTRRSKDPYYTWYDDAAICCRILAEFGLTANCHIVNGHVPVREKAGESPIKGGGRLLVIDGGFCRAYHERTGIAGYTLVYSSHGMSLRTHQPFENTAKAVQENLDILSRVDVVDDNPPTAFWWNHMDEGANLTTPRWPTSHRLISAYHPA